MRRASGLRERPLSRGDAAWLAWAALLVGSYELWGLWYYGELLPNTYTAKGAKSGLDARLLSQPMLSEFATGQGLGFAALLALAATGCVLGRRNLPVAVWLVPACGLLFILYARFDWMPRQRFFVPILPFVGLAIGAGTFECLRALNGKFGQSGPFGQFGRLAGVLVIAVAGLDYVRVQAFAGDAGDKKYERNSELARQARSWWLADVPGQLVRREYPLSYSAMYLLLNVPEGEIVVLRDIGFPGYLTMNPIFDTAGLVTRSVAMARADRGEASDAALFAELLALRPGCFRLVLPRRRTINHRLRDWLERDPQAVALYQRVAPAGRVSDSTAAVVYLRRDLPAVDVERRLERANERVPGFDVRALLAQLPGRAPGLGEQPEE